jgi:hypothetical protein
MQKERAKRKRARTLMVSSNPQLTFISNCFTLPTYQFFKNIGTSAKAQVSSFLDQWRTFTEQSCGELQRSVNAQLENLCAQADTLCAALGQDVDLYAQKDHDMGQDLQLLEKDTTALKTEISTAVSQCRSEEATAKNEVTALRNRALETARKTLSMHKDVRGHSGKQQSLELLRALREV